MLPKGPSGEELPSRVDCPICGGRLETVYERHNQRVVVCSECQSGLTIPASAWDVARLKREKSL